VCSCLGEAGGNNVEAGPISGWIIPAPLSVLVIRYCTPLMENTRDQSLGNISVVMKAFAARSQVSNPVSSGGDWDWD